MSASTSIYANTQRGILLAALGTVSLLGLAPAMAASAESSTQANASNMSTLEEITVTASKRGAQSLQAVPISIQAISGDSLKAIGASSFVDFATTVPSLEFQDLGPGDKKYIIRGINSTGPATVGVYYDEAVITANNKNDGGGRNADIRLYDLERIEVLKGPQGTLYGASSMSGTIRFITNKPKLDEVEGYVQGDVSTTKHGGANYNLNGMVNLPVIKDKLGIRAVGWIVDNSGYIDQPRIPSGPLKGVNTDNTKGGRLLARLNATENLTVTAGVTIQNTYSAGSSRYTPPGFMSYGNTAAGYPAIPGGDLVNTDMTQSPWRENLQIYSLTAEYTGSIGTVTATTNWYKRNIDFWYDSSPILFSFNVFIPGVTIEPQSQRIWSNELRYASNFSGRINFVAGAFMQQEKQDLEVQVIKSNNLGLPNGAFSRLNSDDALLNPDGNTLTGRVDNNVLKQEALFGEVTFDVTDKLKAVVGIRYFHSKLDDAQETTHPFGGFGATPEGILYNSSSESKATYKFNLSYQANKDFMLYATANQGFRVGGLNAANLPFGAGIPRGYRSDSLWNYEVGFKSDFLDNRVRLNGAVYTMRWSNIQVKAVDLNGAYPFTTNAGAAKVDGAELELNALLSKGLELSIGGSYQNAVLTEDQPFVPNNSNLGKKGDTLPNVPKWQGSASLSYTASISGDFTGTVRGDVSYRAKTNTQFNKTSEFNVPLDSYILAGLRASIQNNDWTVAAYVHNLFDKRAQVDAISSTQDPLALITVQPRTLGASVTRRF